jgi:hypothetical protein
MVKGTLTQVEQITQRRMKNENIMKFHDTWSATTIRAICERFHNFYKVGF